ncbi:hypothetical protein [Devosia ginsengisoli]|uniref:hypothetical protein n=1 Tax=Devosia ginsengisoli TaxID=400770 RepID=UPI0026EBE054|nr:hypothetical protein [Devosia ginsengisoli]MCR6673214.1 hypothetical protein [Devosia ginsengisoli]
MNIPPPKKEWNINTIVSVVGFAITLVGLAVAYGQFMAEVSQTRTDFIAYRDATNLRISAVETAARQIDNLTYRLGAAETTNAAISRGLSDLQSAVAQQSGDIRVVREILQRIERQSSSPAVFPLALSEP